MKTARCGHLWARVLKALSLLRFFVALDKEMTCRHAQWLIVIKRKSESCRPLRPKAATQHRPRPLPPVHRREHPTLPKLSFTTGKIPCPRQIPPTTAAGNSGSTAEA